MVGELLKRVLAIGFLWLAERNLKKKFSLYGPYKQMYSWAKFDLLEKHILLFRPIKRKINLEWYKYFTLVRQEEDAAYVPENIWHIYMEPVLNQKSYAKANNDKNLFHCTPFRHLYPTTFLHVIQGICYDPNFNPINHKNSLNLIPSIAKLVVKKSIDSGGGKGVTFYNSVSEVGDFNQLRKLHGENFIVQEKERQHEWFARFNPSSLNTIRVVTYRSVVDEKIYILQTLLRMGKNGSMVDNQSSGGIACGIDKTGKLNSWGTDKLSNRYYSSNSVIFSETGRIPNFEKMSSVCIEIAKTRFHERVLVFDTWQDTNNQIRLTEINNINIGIEDLQKNNGPMFGEFTREVIEYCSTHKRSFCFDYVL